MVIRGSCLGLVLVGCEPVYLGTLDPENVNVDDCNPSIRYIDFDEDGFGSERIEVCAWEEPTERMVEEGGDCNDQYPFVFPGAPEICNGADDDCDDEIDEDFQLLSGNVLTDTVLTEGSTWCIDDTLTIAPEGTLTVEAGVTLAGRILGPSKSGPAADRPGRASQAMRVDNLGSVFVTGAPEDRAHLYDLSIAGSWDGKASKPTVLIEHAWIHGGTLAGVLHGIVIEDSVVDTTSPIQLTTGASVQRNVFLDDAFVDDLVISQSDPGGPPVVTHNVFLGPGADAGGPVAAREIDIQSFLFVGGGSKTVELRGNSFLRDGIAVGYGQENETGLDAVNNYWGTTQELEIVAKIRDQDDALTLEAIPYEPWLVVPDPAAPDPEPFLDRR